MDEMNEGYAAFLRTSAVQEAIALTKPNALGKSTLELAYRKGFADGLRLAKQIMDEEAA